MSDILGGPSFLGGPTRDLQMKECPNPTGAHIFVGRTDNSQLQNTISTPTEVYAWRRPCPRLRQLARTVEAFNWSLWGMISKEEGQLYSRRQESIPKASALGLRVTRA